MCDEMQAGAKKCPVKEEKKADAAKSKEEAPAEAAAIQVKKN